jgi:AAHS family 4-hydroxybenzoate transporter-like MFS transporter
LIDPLETARDADSAARHSGNIAERDHVTIAAAERTVDVAAIFDSARFRGLPLLVYCFTALAFVFDGFDITAIAYAAPALLPEWHLTRAELAPVLAAGLAGMGLGSLALGTLGDRHGRRTMLCVCLLIVSVTSLICATAGDRWQLGVWRLLTGIGLGGAIPNASALMAEFAPARSRSLVMAAALVGIPLGGLLGAEIAARVVPAYGWRALFVIGGVLPGVLAIVMCLAVPESPRFLARRPARRAELERVLARVGGGPWRGDERFVVLEAGVEAAQGRLRDLWSPTFRRDTFALWLAFSASTFAIYGLANWLPTVLAGAGVPLAMSIRGLLAFSLGGVVGTLLVASAMTRFGSRPVLLAALVLGIASTASLVLVPIGSDAKLFPLFAGLALAGASMNGVQVGMVPVAAHVYPTAVRASGVGWAVGVARLAGVVSAFAGSAALGLRGDPKPFFGGVAVVIASVLLGVMLLRRHVPERTRTAADLSRD